MFKIVWIINYCTFCLPLVPEGFFSLRATEFSGETAKVRWEAAREKKSPANQHFSTSKTLSMRDTFCQLLPSKRYSCKLIGTHRCSYILGLLHSDVHKSRDSYAQGFLRPWEKHVCHKSASLHWHFENRSVCNALFKQIIEARLSNISSAKPTSFPALPASTFMVLVIIRGLCLVM